MRERRFHKALQTRERQFHKALQTQEVARQEIIRQQEEEDQKRDLRLHLAIAFFGFGFAVSGVSSQVNPTPLETILGKSLPEESTPWPTSAVVWNALDVLIHIGIGLLAGLGAALLVLLWKQRRL